MRLTPILLVFSATLAEARECKPPDIDNKNIRGLRAFSECMILEVEDLKRENAKLRDEIDKIRKSLADFPGELQNTDGRVARRGGDRLAQASFSRVARARERATSLDIDQKAIVALCVSGCLMSLSLVAEGLREADTAPIATLGPCGFTYNPKSGAWAMSEACGEPVSGVDGDGVPGGSSGGEVIVAVGGACIMADSEPSLSVGSEAGKLGHDRAKGLYLVADPALFQGVEDRFRCELKITR
jgi:hypothetical protein